jgi:hypothetical protein
VLVHVYIYIYICIPVYCLYIVYKYLGMTPSGTIVVLLLFFIFFVFYFSVVTKKQSEYAKYCHKMLSNVLHTFVCLSTTFYHLRIIFAAHCFILKSILIIVVDVCTHVPFLSRLCLNNLARNSLRFSSTVSRISKR